MYVLSGKVKIDYGVHSYVLEAGESIYYDSIVEHLVSGVNNEPAVILAVVYAPY
ncbi:MAG: cupin domain-containing protein [Paludibacter sp.]